MQASISIVTPSVELLLANNRLYVEKFQHSALMRLIASDIMQSSAARHKLLDGIQVFSNYFQKVVTLRHVFCDKPRFLSITQAHLNEEFGHNISLMHDRKHRPPVWDPVLEATSAWFVWKMFNADDEEKTVLVHLVLEASANIFFQAAHQVMSGYGETNYFQIHAEVDGEHELLGNRLLQNLSSDRYQRLMEVQAQGWDMLNATCQQIAHLTLHYHQALQANKVKR